GPNLRRAGGPAYLRQLATNAPIPASATHYAHTGKRHSLTRTTRATGHQPAQTPDTTPTTPPDTPAHARPTLDTHAPGHATTPPIPDSATHHAHIVKRHSLTRTIRATGHHLAHTPDTTPDNPHDIIDHARATLDNIATGNTTTPPQATAVYQSIETLEEPP